MKDTRNAGRSKTLDSGAQGICALLRARRGQFRLLYVPGVGDVVGTYEFWSQGVDDPRNPAIAYSHCFYDIAHALNAKSKILCSSGSLAMSGDGISFSTVVLDGGNKGLRYHLAEVFYVLKVAAQIFRLRPHVVVQNGYLANLWLFAIYKLFSVRLVLTMHNSLWTCGRRRPAGLIHALNGWFFRRAVDGVLLNSEEIKRQITEIAGDSRVRMRLHIPQYADRRLRQPEPPPPLKTDPFHIVYVGRIEADKGVFLVLEAARALEAANPGRYRWTFAGAGGALESARRVAADAKLEKQVRFCGNIDGEAVFGLMANADLLVCPTTSTFREGLPKTPLEAALAGTPSIVSDAVPTAAVLGDACAVVAADSADALKAAIASVSVDSGRLVRMIGATDRVRALVSDRSRSWSSQLAGLLGEIFTISPASNGDVSGTRSASEYGGK